MQPKGIFAAAALATAVSSMAASAETVLHKFTPKEGQDPRSPLVQDQAGHLYGTMFDDGHGGNTGVGTVFKLSPPPNRDGTDWTEQTLFDFTGDKTGFGPAGGLILGAGGALFGTTFEGGGRSACCGTLFELLPPGDGQAWQLVTLHHFKGMPDGSYPLATLLAGPDGVLYGTTAMGGSTNTGTVFALSPPPPGQTIWTETVLYSFAGGSDGSGPAAPLVMDSRGALYGTTQMGGVTGVCGPGCGTVFKLTPPANGQTAWTETILHSFTGGAAGGGYPTGGLYRDSAGTLYGNLLDGGDAACYEYSPGCGAVYSLSPSGQHWKFKIIYGFHAKKDGAMPVGELTPAADGSSLYGVTQGGVLAGLSRWGTVFQLAPPADGKGAWHQTVLYRFPGNGQRGGFPRAGLLHAQDGGYVGTSGRGGRYNGVVYELKP